jgi:cytochrome c556
MLSWRGLTSISTRSEEVAAAAEKLLSAVEEINRAATQIMIALEQIQKGAQQLGTNCEAPGAGAVIAPKLTTWVRMGSAPI